MFLDNTVPGKKPKFGAINIMLLLTSAWAVTIYPQNRSTIPSLTWLLPLASEDGTNSDSDCVVAASAKMANHLEETNFQRVLFSSHFSPESKNIIQLLQGKAK